MEVKRCGYTVRGLAPSTGAVEEMEGAGVAADTIAGFEVMRNKKLTAQTLLIIDEAGMVSTNQMLSILREATAAKCRVLLLGDVAQLQSVEAGRPFAQLQAAGMSTAFVIDILRQKNPELKAAVELAAEGRTALAIELLDKHVTQIVRAGERFDQIAKDYAALTPEERIETRVLAGTRMARAEINRRIRTQLGFGERGEVFTFLTSKDLTDVQRRSTLAYQVGDVLRADADLVSMGLLRGEFARVVERAEHRVMLERDDGQRVHWQPTTTVRLSAYVPEERRLAPGDLVRITAKNHALGLANGKMGTVTAIDPVRRTIRVTISDGVEVQLDGSQPLAIDYGYCSTIHAAQGQTCDRVLIEADAHSLTSARNTFYVAIGRARHAAYIYTDDKEMLPIAMSRERTKESALDLKYEAVECTI
jgi:ATP-dependent exoDNAse (exonuclease V) alpha subunit